MRTGPAVIAAPMTASSSGQRCTRDLLEVDEDGAVAASSGAGFEAEGLGLAMQVHGVPALAEVRPRLELGTATRDVVIVLGEDLPQTSRSNTLRVVLVLVMTAPVALVRVGDLVVDLQLGSSLSWVVFTTAFGSFRRVHVVVPDLLDSEPRS